MFLLHFLISMEQYTFHFEPEELAFYSELQLNVINDKKVNSYKFIVDKYKFTSNQQLENFLFRTILGYRLDIKDSPPGALPYIPQILNQPFVDICMQHAVSLDCVYTHKAVSILEDLLCQRILRAYLIATELKCLSLASKILERFEEISITSEWFSKYCEALKLRLVNAQSLQELRRKFCHSRVVKNFYEMLKKTLHQIPHLLYNLDETYCCTNKNGKIVVPEGRYPFIGEEQNFGHITAALTCNAAGESLNPFLILPTLMNLPKELIELQSQCIFASSPTGWMTSNLFLIWAIFFCNEINHKKEALVPIYGSQILRQTCFLILDGHKSRLNAIAIELLYANNIRVICLPSHSSHVTQPFDVVLARPFKTYFQKQVQILPAWLEERLQNLNSTAKKRYTRVLNIIDAWKQASISKNVCSAWEKSGLYPLNVNRVLSNPYVRETQENDVDKPENKRNQIEINGLEITSFEKRLEISKHFYNIPYLLVPKSLPTLLELQKLVRCGKEKLLSSDCYFYLNLGFGYRYYYI